MSYLSSLRYKYERRSSTLTAAEIISLQLLLKTPTCFYCNEEFIEPSKRVQNVPNMRTMDHIIPRSQDGADHYTNYVHACYTCNTVRGDTDFIEFAITSKLAREFGQLQAAA